MAKAKRAATLIKEYNKAVSELVEQLVDELEIEELWEELYIIGNPHLSPSCSALRMSQKPSARSCFFAQGAGTT
jgi:hypothetical protein